MLCEKIILDIHLKKINLTYSVKTKQLSMLSLSVKIKVANLEQLTFCFDIIYCNVQLR